MSPPFPLLPLLLVMCSVPGVVAPPSGGAQASSAPLPGVRCFLSNELGMPLEEIGWYRREEAAYVLELRVEGEFEARTLFREGKEVKRWERSAGQERVFEEGELVERTVFGNRGRRLEFWEYEAGAVVRRTAYSYPRAGEIRSRSFDGEGNLLYSDRSLLSAGQGLRRVSRVHAGGQRAGFSLSMAADRLIEARASGDGQALIDRYDSSGRLIERERWSGERIVERESLSYGDDGEVPATTVTAELVSGRTTTRIYDEDGRLAAVEVEQGGRMVDEYLYERDADGREALVVRKGPLGLEQWRYEYGEDGELSREEYRLRGSLERVSRHEGQGRSIEELHRGGEVFMRVTYEDGEKVKEEFLKNGTVVRTRDYR